MVFPSPALMKTSLPAALVLLLAAAPAALLRASDNVPAPAQSHPVVLRGATLHPVSGPDIPDGTLVFDRGRILAVAPAGVTLPLPAGAEVIELRGRHVYPGMVAANSVLGLAEIPSVRATLDFAETGALNPNARAQVSINPDSELLPVTRAGGVLAAHVIPRVGDGLVGGLSALVNLDGWTWENMTIRPAAGLHVFWPSLRIERDPRFPKPPEEQQKEIDARLRLLRETFAAARAYAQPAGAKNPPAQTNVRLAAMAPALRGEMPVFVHADELRQIEDALTWADGEKLRLVLVGGRDAWRAAPRLRERGVPVILAGVNVLPTRRWEGFDTPYANAARLHAAGVKFCIAGEGTDFDAANERNLPFHAAQAAAHGLPREEALRAVTLSPAEILGVADRLGSLEPGKDANFIVTDGDPLEILSHVEAAWIAGRPVDLSTKQTRLDAKYRRRYGQ